MVTSSQGLTDQSISFQLMWESNATTTAAETAVAQVIPHGERSRGMHIQPARHWQVPVVRLITELLELPANWNSYGSSRIRRDTAMFAIEILENVMAAGTPLPAVVPTPNGGIQLEWHENGVNFEIDVLEPYHCEYAYNDERSAVGPVYGVLENDLQPLQQPILVLTQRAEDEMFTLRRPRVAA
jgi:hypothetical protein